MNPIELGYSDHPPEWTPFDSDEYVCWLIRVNQIPQEVKEWLSNLKA